MRWEHLERRLVCSVAPIAIWPVPGVSILTAPTASTVSATTKTKSSAADPTTVSKSGASDTTPISPGTLALAVQAVALSGGGIRIEWQPLGLDSDGQIEVFRKAPDDNQWTAPAVGEPNYDATHFDDLTAVTGVAYEYKVAVYAIQGDPPIEKYVVAGNQAAPVVSRGTVLLVVDSTQLDTTRDASGTTLLPALEAYQSDLIAEGYRVQTITAPRVDVPRGTPPDPSPAGVAAYFAPWSNAVMALKAQIRSIWQQTPDLSSIVLLGHVAVPYSGSIDPDGHSGAAGASPSDVFYTTLSTPDSAWTDTLDGGGSDEGVNLVGDGKFDQDTLAEVGFDTDYDSQAFSDVSIGRIDFSQLDSFNGIDSNAGAKASVTETQLLSMYLQKDRAWRTGQVNVQRKALFKEQNPFPEYYDTNRLTPNVGFNDIIPGSVGPTEDFSLPPPQSDPAPQSYDLTSQSWLWLYAAAGGYPSKNVIHFDPQHELHVNHYANGQYAAPGSYAAAVDEGTHKAVFNFIYGSYNDDWDHSESLLRTVLAEPGGLGLDVAWGARPNWQQHAMGLGYPIGYSLVKTLNNFGDRQAYSHQTFDSSVRDSLLGDPTIRQDNVVPPTNAVTAASSNGTGTTVSWAASTDAAVAGYYIFRSSTADGPYTQLNSTMVSGTTFTDSATSPSTEAHYLVRAAKLQTTPSGTYWNLSIGAETAPRVMSAQFITNAGGPQTIQIKFDQDVGSTFTASALSIAGSNFNLATRSSTPVTLTAGVDFHVVSYDSATHTARISIDTTNELNQHGVIPAGRYSLSFGTHITNSLGVPVATNYAFSFGYIPGDANGDLRVDFNDLVVIAQNFSHSTTNGSISGDFNADGVVNFDDLVILAQRYNVIL